MKKENAKKKKTIKIIVISIVSLFVLFILFHLIPFLYFAISMLWNMFFAYPDKPIQKHGEFPFELIYSYKGEERTIKDTIICDFDGFSYAIETGNTIDWEASYMANKEYGVYQIDSENEPNLSIDIPDACEYYMGENEAIKEDAIPHIYYSDENTGTQYYEENSIDVVDVKIITWKPSEPLKNNFK